jgi:DNA polymerase delta subunit 2
MFKYLPTPPTTRISIAEATLRWRHIAPTAPDTLWCHPYFTTDPFIIQALPDIYAIGCQPEYATSVVKDPASAGRCRVVLVPRFKDTGIIVLVNLKTLQAKKVKFELMGFGSE